MQTHFHKKGCAPGLILKVRVFGTRKWPIHRPNPSPHPTNNCWTRVSGIFFRVSPLYRWWGGGGGEGMQKNFEKYALFYERTQKWQKNINTTLLLSVIVAGVNPFCPKSDQRRNSPCFIETEWYWELRTWSHKMNYTDTLSTSPHYFCRKCSGTINESANFDMVKKSRIFVSRFFEPLHELLWCYH